MLRKMRMKRNGSNLVLVHQITNLITTSSSLETSIQLCSTTRRQEFSGLASFILSRLVALLVMRWDLERPFKSSHSLAGLHYSKKLTKPIIVVAPATFSDSGSTSFIDGGHLCESLFSTVRAAA